MVSSPLKWILFDLDNTLLNFDVAADHALIQLFNHFDLSPEDKLTASYHEINRDCWNLFEKGSIDIKRLKALRFERFVQENNLPHPPSILNTFYLQQLASNTVEMPGARSLLEVASARHQLALVTNGFAEVQRPRIIRSGIQSFFKHIVISEEIGSNKPHKDFFNHTMALLGHPQPSEVMIIGDSLGSDILGGHNAGIRTCWYNPLNKAQDPAIMPQHMVQNLQEIPSLWQK